MMGLDFQKLYTTMGIKKIQHVINHGCKELLTGGLLRVTYQQLAVEAGLEGKIFQYNYKEYGANYVTKTWIRSLWEFVSKHEITLSTNMKVTEKQREGDIYLMNAFYKTGYKGKQLALLNRC